MPFIQKDNIILASSSVIRKKIMKDLGLSFIAMKPDFDEESAKKNISYMPIKEQAIFLAKNKALSISKKNPNHLVIASDQICQIDNHIIPKSHNFEQAVKQLNIINNSIHYQNNAVCLFKKGSLLISHFEYAKLKMHNLSKKEICSYVELDQSWGCCW